MSWYKQNILYIYIKSLVNSIIFNLVDNYTAYDNRVSIAMLEINRVAIEKEYLTVLG